MQPRRRRPLTASARNHEHYIVNGETRHVVVQMIDNSFKSFACRMRTAYTVQGIITHYAVTPLDGLDLTLVPIGTVTAFAGIKVSKKMIFEDPEKAAKAAFLMNLKRKA
jgi:hypothetical protein